MSCVCAFVCQLAYLNKDMSPLFPCLVLQKQGHIERSGCMAVRMTISFLDVSQRQRSSSLLLVCFWFCRPQKPPTLDMLGAPYCFLLVLCSCFFFSFFLLRFLKRISLFDVGINAGMGMPWRGCEGQRRAWVFILGVHFVSDRLCSFSTTHTHSRPAVSTSCHPRRALILQVLSLRAWLLLMGLQIHSGSHASTFATELFPQPLPPFVRPGLRIPRWP